MIRCLWEGFSDGVHKYDPNAPISSERLYLDPVQFFNLLSGYRPVLKTLEVSNLKLKMQKAKWNALDEASVVQFSKNTAARVEAMLSKFLNTKYKKTFANVASFVPMPRVAA